MEKRLQVKEEVQVKPRERVVNCVQYEFLIESVWRLRHQCHIW